MDKDKLLAILAEFFRDWFAQGDDDIDEFVAALDAAVPPAPHTR